MSDALKMQNRLKAFALEESLPLESLIDDLVVLDKAAADAMAADATADAKVWSNGFDFPLQVVGLTFNPTSGGVTANDTNFAQINVKTDDGAGGAAALAMRLETKLSASGGTGNLTANIGVSTAVKQSGGAVIPVGGSLFFGITKQGAGVIVPSGKTVIRLRRI
jgi:hypothetical protein